jgi:hypothetical protein
MTHVNMIFLKKNLWFPHLRFTSVPAAEAGASAAGTEARTEYTTEVVLYAVQKNLDHSKVTHDRSRTRVQKMFHFFRRSILGNGVYWYINCRNRQSKSEQTHFPAWLTIHVVWNRQIWYQAYQTSGKSGKAPTLSATNSCTFSHKRNLTPKLKLF